MITAWTKPEGAAMLSVLFITINLGIACVCGNILNVEAESFLKFAFFHTERNVERKKKR